MKTSFSYGPFTINPTEDLYINGCAMTRANIEYENVTVGFITFASNSTCRALVQSELFQDIIHQFTRSYKTPETHIHELVVSTTGNAIASFNSTDYVLDGMTSTLINDDSRYWMRTGDGLHSVAVTLNGYAVLYAKYATAMRPKHAWIRGLLPAEVLTQMASEWRAPTEWELRHVVGEESFTGVTGNVAAAMVGISETNFRKYTASSTAKNRQQMSFATWHLLLAKLGV